MSKTAHGLPIRAAPYRHQREAADYALEHLKTGGGAALLMEMGTGKTLTSIAIVGQLWNVYDQKAVTETFTNENHNGNGLYEAVRQWAAQKKLL